MRHQQLKGQGLNHIRMTKVIATIIIIYSTSKLETVYIHIILGYTLKTYKCNIKILPVNT